MPKSKNTDLTRSTSTEVDEFLKKVELAPRPVASSSRGRRIFGMDATASREPMWDQACHIQSEMFTATASHGGLDVQLCFYRGFHPRYSVDSAIADYKINPSKFFSQHQFPVSH